jgi:hypothetical protein
MDEKLKYCFFFKLYFFNIEYSIGINMHLPETTKQEEYY